MPLPAILPALPLRAAYLTLSNPARRNALSLAVLRDLRTQLEDALRSRMTGRPLLLPPFRPSLLGELVAARRRIDEAETAAGGESPEGEHDWLVSAALWLRHRGSTQPVANDTSSSPSPSVLVLRATDPAGNGIFSSGHDLRELASLAAHEQREAFALCAGLMSTIRRSPLPVVCVLPAAPGALATAAGAQLALTCDVTVGRAEAAFQLPGMAIGLPCTSPVTAVGRRVAGGLAYRMFATGERVRADALSGVVETVVVDQEGGGGNELYERRVFDLVSNMAALPAQAQALGKWAFWTQSGIRGSDDLVAAGQDVDLEGQGRVEPQGDGYEAAVGWAAGAMALHARCEDAREGMAAFMEKRKPAWRT